LQLLIVWWSLVAHRGTSKIQDDFLAYFDIYRTLGNWRIESSDLLLASSTDLSESVWIEWHAAGASEDQWTSWPDQNRPPAFGRSGFRQQKWLRQLVDLINLGITEGASQMVVSATQSQYRSDLQPVDQVRVILAPAIPRDKYAEVEAASSIEDLSEELRPQTVFDATVLVLENGQMALLPQLENRRVAPATNPATNSAKRSQNLSPVAAESSIKTAPVESGGKNP